MTDQDPNQQVAKENPNENEEAPESVAPDEQDEQGWGDKDPKDAIDAEDD